MLRAIYLKKSFPYLEQKKSYTIFHKTSSPEVGIHDRLSQFLWMHFNYVLLIVSIKTEHLDLLIRKNNSIGGIKQ